ncbi:class I SAM-dependent methyltransferase [Streptomyces sp. NPDC092296]|uniref:class I SAM-dependent methyltransferase n=1 Tax=Streptomyces sp. NPDC092296 TaxID=3366012 RepID=UPI003802AE65
MTSPQVAPEILSFYGEVYDEAARLVSGADGVLELVRTQELLRRRLPGAPAAVLDVGGGPGTHARWLVQDGYDVHLVDPVPRHVEQARVAGCTVELGDARRLTAADASYDVVLLLGPLYHLQDAGDRARALAEAYRAVRPGGLVAAAAINRYAPLLHNAATGNLARPGVQAAVDSSLTTGRHDGRHAFTRAYFHTPAELGAELRHAGLTQVHVHGVEGPAWSQLKAVEQHSGPVTADSPLFAAALAAARAADHHPALLAATSHLLAVAHRPADV